MELETRKLPDEPPLATKAVVDMLQNEIWPLIKNVQSKLETRIKASEESANDDFTKKLSELVTLCCSQLQKCLMNLFDIFRMENKNKIVLQDSRNCTLERLSWCMSRLETVSDMVDKVNEGDVSTDFNESFLTNPMYFVNWIDQTFDLLGKLSNIIYRTDYQISEDLYDIWKIEVVECVSELHESLDELLLSAMTLCRYCLPADQHVVKARCQVVLREAKTLLTELIQGDFDSVKLSKDSLKLPVMPSNVNVLIDVLKDVLYSLETNTNTALLTLLVHCFSNTVSPIEELKRHLSEGDERLECSCVKEGQEDCKVIADFDLYNERLMQIGAFAISCSSDVNRISILRSGLASLEALEAHVVPALCLNDTHCASKAHATLLMSSWQQEVREIRDSVYLIVDPAAFAEKCKQTMHDALLRIIEKKTFDINLVCPYINIGSVLCEFFFVYCKQEPDALQHHDKLVNMLADLNKIEMEVKIVTNLLSTTPPYDTKMPNKTRTPTFDQLLKRLKVLYTMVARINDIYHPKDNDDLFMNQEYEQTKNITQTIHKTCANKTKNVTRSFFARTQNITNGRVKKLTKHATMKSLDFSVKLGETFELPRMVERSVLYNRSPRKGLESLRKRVLSRNYVEPQLVESVNENDDFIDEATSLQITEILDQMNNMSTLLNSTKHINTQEKHVLNINLENSKLDISRKIWSIPVNLTAVDIDLTSDMSNLSSEKTDVTSFERMNDIEMVDKRLSELKMRHETSL